MCSASHKPSFHWDDPLLLDAQLIEDERAVRDAAHAHCHDRLAPRVLEAFRNEQTDVAIFREMGELGVLGVTIPEAYGGSGPTYVRSRRARGRARRLGLPLEDERAEFAGDGADQ